MAAKVKFFIFERKKKSISEDLPKRKLKKKEEVNILVRFSNGRQFDIISKSQKQINPKFWNNKAGMVRDVSEFKDKDELQAKLNVTKGHIIKAYDNLLDKSVVNKDWLNITVDESFSSEKTDLKGNTLFAYIQNFNNNSATRINPSSGNPVSYKMRREYEVTFEYLRKYAKEFGEPDFSDIDLEFYQKFVDFLRRQKIVIKDKEGNIIKEKYLSLNTIGKKIQTLKIFLNAATEEGINKHQKYKSRKFKSLSEEADNIYLTKEELIKFYNKDFSKNPHLERVRDFFIVGSWTGLRYSDLQQVTTDKIKGNFIELRQKKTGQKVIIPVHQTVREILNKYNGKLPKPISNQKFNDYLKDAAKLAGLDEVFVKTVSYQGKRTEESFKKHEVITSHTARRSFCTNAYKDDIPTLAIMAISGHRTENAFLKYIKADGEEHAQKILEMWQKTNHKTTLSE